MLMGVSDEEVTVAAAIEVISPLVSVPFEASEPAMAIGRLADR